MQSITKRNGEKASFDPTRIRKAIKGAFWEDYNERSHQEKLPVKTKGDLLDPATEKAIDDITTAVVETITAKGIDNVEAIQDQVEMALYRTGHAQIAHRYVVYRLERKKQRQKEQAAAKFQVKRSNGELVPFNPKPIEDAAKAACQNIPEVSYLSISAETERALYDGVETREITEAMLQSSRSLIEKEPNYTFVTARLLLQKLAEECFGELDFEFKASQLPINYDGYFQAYIKRAQQLGLLRDEMLEFDLDKIAKAIRPERDLLLRYMGMQTLYDRYFIKTRYQKRIELPQAFWMRVAMGLARKQKNKEDAAIRYYEVLSSLRFVSSTPTLFNAGTKHEQLSSCYLLTVEDDLIQIFKNYADNARLSKWAGGIGNDFTPVRGRGAHIVGTNGDSQGGVPWWKITNDVAVAVNQGSKRKGAICNYLETWHIDIEDFLELRKNTGDERLRTHDMNTANWIPDLFMKRQAEDGSWWLFSPETVKGLHDLYGKDFEDKYKEFEAAVEAGPTVETADTNMGMVTRTLPQNPFHPAKKVSAKSLWKKMLTMIFETGHPWITFKDPGNIRNPQDHKGVIHSSNLCTEIFLNTKSSTTDPKTNAIIECGEVAVCNLGSANLAAHIFDGKLNAPLLRETVAIGVEMLDNVVDINFYPIAEAEKSNLEHRPIGFGMMGFHTAIQMMGIPYDSDEAVEFSDVSQEIIALAALNTSSDLAAERGAYPSFKGSKWDRGLLPPDTVKLIAENRGTEFTDIDYSSAFPEEWDKLRIKIQKQGMRNSNVMATAPTATIANISGVDEGVTPCGGVLYTKENLSGGFTLCNPILVDLLKKENLWNENTIQLIKMNEGSIQGIESIPEYIRLLFKNAYEIPAEKLIECASRRQKWIDQGQSVNLFAFQPTGKQLSEMYNLAWRKGLKSTYYLRTKGASVREKTTVEVQHTGTNTRLTKKATPEEVAACSIEAQRAGIECEACQ